MILYLYHMTYNVLITTSTEIEAGEKFPIYLNDETKIGIATFTHKEKDEFVFDAQPIQPFTLDQYDIKPTVDTDTNALIDFRAAAK